MLRAAREQETAGIERGRQQGVTSETRGGMQKVTPLFSN